MEKAPNNDLAFSFSWRPWNSWFGSKELLPNNSRQTAAFCWMTSEAVYVGSMRSYWNEINDDITFSTRPWLHFNHLSDFPVLHTSLRNCILLLLLLLRLPLNWNYFFQLKFQLHVAREDFFYQTTTTLSPVNKKDKVNMFSCISFEIMHLCLIYHSHEFSIYWNSCWNPVKHFELSTEK